MKEIYYVTMEIQNCSSYKKDNESSSHKIIRANELEKFISSQLKRHLSNDDFICAIFSHYRMAAAIAKYNEVLTDLKTLEKRRSGLELPELNHSTGKIKPLLEDYVDTVKEGKTCLDDVIGIVKLDLEEIKESSPVFKEKEDLELKLGRYHLVGFLGGFGSMVLSGLYLCTSFIRNSKKLEQNLKTLDES